jgi:hypothetical protein
VSQRLNSRRALPDILAGVVFIVFGAAFAVASLRYEVGTLLRMGPGYFPLALGVILVALGVLTVGKGLVAGEVERLGSVPWRSLVLIVAALLCFGLTVRGLGLVPATALTALLTVLASYRIKLLTAVVVTAGLTLLSVLIFPLALRLPLPMFGPWLGF